MLLVRVGIRGKNEKHVKQRRGKSEPFWNVFRHFLSRFKTFINDCLDDVSYMFRLSMKQYIHQILQLKSQLVAETNENQKQVKIYISLFIWFPLDFVFT